MTEKERDWHYINRLKAAILAQREQEEADGEEANQKRD